MRNKLIFKLVDPSIECWNRYISMEEKLIILCETLGVQVYDHSSNKTEFTKTVFVEFNSSNEIVNCIFQVAHFLDSENLEFELVERTEIDAKHKEIGNLPLYKVNKLIDQLNEGLEKLRNIG